MKKVLLSMSLAALIFVGCGDKITDEQAKNYENSLNQNIKETLSLAKLVLDSGNSVSINDFKCSSKSEYVECISQNPSIKMNGQDIITLKDIKVVTNQIYTGDAKGDLSIKEAFKGMPSETKYTKVSLTNVGVGDFAKGLFSILAMSDPNFSKLSFLVNDNYTLDINQEFDKNDDLNISAKVSSKNANLEGSMSLALTQGFYDLLNNAGVRFNVSKQTLNNQALFENIEEEDFDPSSILIKDSIKVGFSVANTDFVNEFINTAGIKGVEPKLDKIIESVLNSKPHKVELEIKFKNQVQLDGIDEYNIANHAKIILNGIDVTEEMMGRM